MPAVLFIRRGARDVVVPFFACVCAITARAYFPPPSQRIQRFRPGFHSPPTPKFFHWPYFPRLIPALPTILSSSGSTEGWKRILEGVEEKEYKRRSFAGASSVLGGR